MFNPGAVQPKLELNLENVQALRQTMTQQSNQLYAARRQCHVRSAMVYNQQIKIHGLMLENSGLAADIASMRSHVCDGFAGTLKQAHLQL